MSAVRGEKIIRVLRAKLRQKEFYVVENKREIGSDRRLAFFSFCENDRRIGERRNLI